jgi:hypothetical protein
MNEIPVTLNKKSTFVSFGALWMRSEEMPRKVENKQLAY